MERDNLPKYHILTTTTNKIPVFLSDHLNIPYEAITYKFNGGSASNDIHPTRTHPTNADSTS